MIRINNTNWEDLEISDVEEFLQHAETESVFFDNKADSAGNEKIAKEICAFANTFGGYVFIGVKDDNTIEGCTTWTEERVHNVVHDTITPTPIIDTKQLSTDKSYILIVRVEEGNQPPYITNTGKIYERLSSGSYPVKNSNKLDALNRKKENHKKKINRKIESLIPTIRCETARNLVGCIDVGVALTTSSMLDFEENFYTLDLSKVAQLLSKNNNKFTISRVGPSLQMTYGELTSDSDNTKLVDAGMNDYIVLYADGSFYYRLMLFSDASSEKTDITIIYTIVKAFEDVYKVLIGDDINKKYIYAEKYQKLHVFRQFIPYYSAKYYGNYDYFKKYLDHHVEKYGENKIVAGVRYPFEGYIRIDKQSFDMQDTPLNKDTLSELLMRTEFLNLGYIDLFETGRPAMRNL